jgi:peptide/nickel transport system ATP-binding protein
VTTPANEGRKAVQDRKVGQDTMVGTVPSEGEVAPEKRNPSIATRERRVASLTPSGETPYLVVQDLTVKFPTADGVVSAVNGLSYAVPLGRTLAIVGESGSGKSVSSMAVMGLHDRKRTQITGSIQLGGDEIVGLPESELMKIRGDAVAMVFQDPQSSLHPLYTVGNQITEAYRVHHKVSKDVAKKRALEMLDLVGIPNPIRRYKQYPHEFSGGMRQRAMIAMAMAMNPSLLIADEPTTALDVTVQAQVLRVIGNLQREFDTALIIITHDLGVIADIADDVVVMYAGAVMERAGRRSTFYRFHHPYTEGLLLSLPVPGDRRRLTPIPGQPPSLITLPSGCPFHPRCRYAFDQCREQTPPLRDVPDEAAHVSACWLPTQSDERDGVRRIVRARGQTAAAGGG